MWVCTDQTVAVTVAGTNVATNLAKTWQRTWQQPGPTYLYLFNICDMVQHHHHLWNDSSTPPFSTWCPKPWCAMCFAPHHIHVIRGVLGRWMLPVQKTGYEEERIAVRSKNKPATHSATATSKEEARKPEYEYI